MSTNTSTTIQRAITPKLLRFRIFALVLFERGQNSKQNECIFMQFNSKCKPGASNEAQKSKILFFKEILRNEIDKDLIMYHTYKIQ